METMEIVEQALEDAARSASYAELGDGQALYDRVRDRYGMIEADVIRAAFEKMDLLAKRDVPMSGDQLRGIPEVAKLTTGDGKWHTRLYNKMRKSYGGAKAAMARSVEAALALQTHLDEFDIAAPETWSGSREPAELHCNRCDTDFQMTPMAVYAKVGDPCPKCGVHEGPRLSTIARATIEFREHGYSVAKAQGPRAKWKVSCDTCGAARSMSNQQMDTWVPCAHCKPVESLVRSEYQSDLDWYNEVLQYENETIWVALDRDPYFHAFIFIGRKPAFLEGVDVDIEPVFALVEDRGLAPKHYFTTERAAGRPSTNPRGKYEYIDDLEAEGVTYMPGTLDWMDFVDMRALTCYERKYRVPLLMPKAIDYIAGRNPSSRYAGDDGFLPLNTQYNLEFEGWTHGKPCYTFVVDDSPLAKALGVNK